jgi:hypothetical protein
LAGTLRPEKKGQSSGRLCFSAGSNYNRKKLQLEKKSTVELSDRLFFTAGSNYNQKNYNWKKIGTAVWPMEVAQIWRERYDRKKNVQLSGRLCFSVGSNYNRIKSRPKKKKVQSSGQPFFPVIFFSGCNLIDEETCQKT